MPTIDRRALPVLSGLCRSLFSYEAPRGSIQPKAVLADWVLLIVIRIYTYLIEGCAVAVRPCGFSRSLYVIAYVIATDPCAGLEVRQQGLD
jgi:hypothetical protein